MRAICSVFCLFVALGGILIGLVVGWVAYWVRSKLNDTPVEITVSLITPYAAYLPAEVLVDAHAAKNLRLGVGRGLLVAQPARASGARGDDEQEG